MDNYKQIDLNDYVQAGRFAVLDVILRTVFQKLNFIEKVFFGFYVHKLMKQYYS
ncbi:MAG: hypothetical protein IJR07_09035 [Bacteroidaceae bacterium]|nr:hypothetical protein [Bacteroidaceae bacterium]